LNRFCRLLLAWYCRVIAEREVYELRNRAEEHIERRLQEAIADDKVVELPNWRRDVVA